MYAKINQNGIVTEWPLYEGQLQTENPLFKFPLDVDDNREYNLSTQGKSIPDGYVKVKLQAPNYGDKKPYLYEVKEGLPELVNGEYVQTWSFEAHGPEKLQANVAKLAQIVRQERDQLLADSDKKVFVDVWEKLSPVEKEQISNYRQSLRDIPDQDGFPISVDWPLEPSIFIIKEV
jgi:hypothetical protein